MLKSASEAILDIYRESLKRYEAEGNEERIRIQKRLIARMEEDLRPKKKK